MLLSQNPRCQNLLQQSQQLYQQGRLEEALKAASAAKSVCPTAAEAWNAAGMLALMLGKPKTAKTDLRKAIKLEPKRLDFMMNLVECLDLLEQYAERRKVLQTLLGLDPKHLSALRQLATTHTILGERDAAIRVWQQVLALDEEDGFAYLGLAGLKVFGPQGVQVEKLIELLNRPGLKKDNRQQIGYALGRIQEQAGKYAAAFSAYLDANAIKSANSGVDYAKRMSAVVSVIADFSPAVFSKTVNQGHPSKHPIFIVGMPRSGTTLLERMLAAHPQIQGAGERRYLGDILGVELANLPPGVGVLQGLAIDKPKMLKKMGEVYLKLMSRHVQSDRFMVDKMPLNSAIAGFVPLIFPNATVIQCHRAVKDVAISCLASDFAADSLKYNLQELGQFIAINDRMMAHWRAVLPENRLQSVHYEELVREPKAVLKPILAAIGVKWSDQCLEFHKQKAAVKTASVTQVRRKLYTGSIGRGERFGTALDPVIEAYEAAMKTMA